MSPHTRARLVEEVFLAALEAGPERMQEVLGERCGDDEALRREVEELLGHHDGARGMLDAPVVSLTGGLSRDAGYEGLFPAGTMVGGHRVVRQIGAGGMGVVYLAEQEKPKRTVVLKIIRPLLATPTMLRRFEREAETLGRLQHPGIAQVYEAGMAETVVGSLPFIAMEYVDGEPLTTYVETRAMGVRERIELMARVCEAVQHAHQRGVIHRDLKPGNILVEEGGRPKILDFGIARAAAQDEQATTLLTDAGLLLGTLPYMSPEQVAGDPDAIDTRSDVYSLGVILYEALTGRLPYDVGSRSMLDAARIIREQSPMRLSTVNRTLRGEVEVIVGRALEKDRTRRYQSAMALGEDLRRHLRGEPIEAKRDSALYVIRKQLARHHVAASAAAVVLLALIAFGVTSAAQARTNRGLARGERQARIAADQARLRADAESERLRRGLYFSRIGFAQAAYMAHDTEKMRAVLDECPEDLRGWEWGYLTELVEDSMTTVMPRTRFTGLRMSVAEGVNEVYLANAHGEALRCDALTGETLETRAVGTPPYTMASHDGTRLLSTESTPGGGALTRCSVSDARTGERLWERDVNVGALRWATLDRAGARVACVGLSGGYVLDAGSGEELFRLGGEEPHFHCVAFSPGGELIVTGDWSGAVVAWSAATGERLRELGRHESVVRALSFSSDGSLVASASWDSTAAVWEVAGAERAVSVVRAHKNKVWSVALSPDGKWLASAGTDSSIVLSDPETGRTERVLHGSGHTVVYLAFDATGSRLISHARDGSVRWWRVPPPESPKRIRVREMAMSLGTDGAGERLIIGGSRGEAEVWDVHTMRRIATLEGHQEEVWVAQLSADGRRAYTADWGGVVRRWDVESGACTGTLRVLRDRAHRGELSADGSRLVFAARSGHLCVVNVEEMSLELEIEAHRGECWGSSWSPDGLRIASSGEDAKIRVWDARDGSLLREMDGGEPAVWTVRWMPNGGLLAGGESGVIRWWNPDDGSLVRVMSGHRGAVYGLGVQREEERIASGSFDNNVKIWDATTGLDVLTLQGHILSVTAVVFDPRGDWLASANQDGYVMLWGLREEGARVKTPEPEGSGAVGRTERE
ncbi:MAG: protein kinase [Phycisphaerales bacterium]